MTTPSSTRPSSYHPSRTVQEEAQIIADELLAKARAGQTLSHYGKENKRVEVYTLAGGGPGAEAIIVFDTDGDVEEGFVSYFDGSGVSAVSLRGYEAETIREAFRR